MYRTVLYRPDVYPGVGTGGLGLFFGRRRRRRLHAVGLHPIGDRAVFVVTDRGRTTVRDASRDDKLSIPETYSRSALQEKQWCIVQRAAAPDRPATVMINNDNANLRIWAYSST